MSLGVISDFGYDDTLVVAMYTYHLEFSNNSSEDGCDGWNALTAKKGNERSFDKDVHPVT